jgi:two-component system, OmpR family, sensor kinase
MSSAWRRLGLRGRLALSIGAIVVAAFAVVFVAVRAQMSNESAVIKREEAREPGKPDTSLSGSDDGSAVSPIEDAQSDVEKTFFLVGGASLLAALLAGYLVAARTSSPLRRFAATATRVDAGDLTPRLEASGADAAELRTLAEAFNHMLDRLDHAFARQREFVSDASHELRSPLTAMRGQVEVLARQPNPSTAEVRRVEAVVLRELGRTQRLVESLLALARLDEGAGPSFDEVQAGPFFGELADGAGSVESADLLQGSIDLDPDLIAQVVRNLIENAERHAGPEGRVTLSTAQDGGSLVIRVDDDGSGIPPAERERVFDRFHRSQPSRDRASGGSGLGLGIARSIVLAHGGRIWVEDSPLGGARVSFELPGFRPTVRDLSPDP